MWSPWGEVALWVTALWCAISLSSIASSLVRLVRILGRRNR